MKEQIFDKIRRKYVALTPEEEVRQLVISVLHEHFHYPLSRFSCEAQIKVGQRHKRYDIIILDGDRKPFMLIECKAKHVDINEQVLDQAISYNISLKARYILLTNSVKTMIFENTSQGYLQKNEIPYFK
ncbi:MAG: type I restriction enzyme HsdR N-terminal domain-containing protein [Bacteroidales bacterium]|nr:type I restriction enzyme HsdR N-terminal domain-containing protein [Bacteroidales bacterium]